ncbi:phosphate ABC transporter substrate-binding protein PstS [Streptomyces sp. LHD-70]|uniref:phosphate ABC transporter substrate-binding protein PstS n=1 Tax=Streptomyces sp. LHD-70 TaxID=3072140 RepID=UPI0028106027|nr:phosphate ABC transporter substrate-binding protein PstS [Streptomyces sp. LHD-70]MDQ8705289.1 phosphate ABC transporter substrate-binding protein PstS [Streptomyces sp. LHD-70]
MVVGGLLLAGCGLTGSSEDTGQRPAAKPASVVELDCAERGQVAGAGSSAQQNAMTYWMKEYQRACPGVEIAYNPLGSGAGVAQFLRGATAFGGSDSALSEKEVRVSEHTCVDGRAVNLPMAGGPVAIGFNLPGVDELVLDAPTLAELFDGRITSWDDPRVKALNPDVDLPATPVHPVHRSDDSGTTQNFQSYLSEAAGDSWPYPAKKNWLGHGGSSASGSKGVATAVTSTTGAIGYLDLSVAVQRHVDTVSVDTGASRPVGPTPESASKGIAEARTVGRGKDLSLEFDYGTSAEGAYPIVLVTYEIVCDRGNMPDSLPALKSFLTYTASTEGQQVLPRLHYAPLPKELASEVRDVIRTLD